MKKGRFLWSAHRITEMQKAGKARNIKGKQLKNSRSTDLNPKVDDFKMVEVYTAVKEILSEEELELLRCYYEYGYTSQEIAQKLGVTETCFKVRILRMKQKIRNSMLLPFLFGVCGVLYQLIIFIGDKI